jgi:hypothetical protein
MTGAQGDVDAAGRTDIEDWRNGPNDRQRGSSQLGMTQLGQASSGVVMEGDARFRNRGGMMQEY